MGLTDWTSQIGPIAQTNLIVWTGWTGGIGLTDWTSQIGFISFTSKNYGIDSQTLSTVWTG